MNGYLQLSQIWLGTSHNGKIVTRSPLNETLFYLWGLPSCETPFWSFGTVERNTFYRWMKHFLCRNYRQLKHFCIVQAIDLIDESAAIICFY